MKMRSITQRIIYGLFTIVLSIIAMVGLGFGCAEKTPSIETVQTQEIQESMMQKGMKGMKGSSPYTSCQVVEKGFINKGGKTTGHMELYLRCSIQDYFIKFCESEVNKRDVAKYLNAGITVDMEIREGEWDSCPDEEFPVQSRVGFYAVIKKIIK